VKVCEVIELPFEVENWVDLGIGVLDGVHIPQGKVLGIFVNMGFAIASPTEKLIRFV